MSDKILNPEGYGLKIYNRFPPRYREDDEQTDYSLKRYLDALGDGGFKYNIEEFNGILEFANPDMATPQALPVLYQQYGLDIFYGIPEPFLRYLLPRLGEAWSKKGSLDVVQFVVSSLTGIKTETEVVNYPNGDTDLNVRLEMDMAMTDYFPDPKQFLRILDKFLPFYLGRSIIYSYFFNEESTIHGEDQTVDHIVQTLTETGGFYSSGFHYANTTNNPDKLVNSTFITNEFSQVAPIPDVFRDIIRYIFHERGELKPVDDYHRDTIILSPVHEEARIRNRNTDSRKDHLVIVDKGDEYLPVTNTDRLTNMKGFITNATGGGGDKAYVLATDEEVDSAKIAMTYKEGAVVSVPMLGFITNTFSRLTNKCMVSVPGDFDIVTHRDGSKEGLFLYI